MQENKKNILKGLLEKFGIFLLLYNFILLLYGLGLAQPSRLDLARLGWANRWPNRHALFFFFKWARPNPA
jgi:hypothetical protein